MDVVERYNVHVAGRVDGQAMLFAHGFGCDQHMWRHVAPRFEDRFRVVLFDHIGADIDELLDSDVIAPVAVGEHVRDAIPDSTHVLHGVLDDVLTFQSAFPRDDVAIVAVNWQPPTDALTRSQPGG